jgi:hypothetical protein
MKRKSLTETYKDMQSQPRHYRDHGETAWFNDAGKFHRIGGPADEFDNGDKVFYVNGLRHNEDGAAIQLANGQNYFYLNGKELTEKKWAQEVKKLKPQAPQVKAG